MGFLFLIELSITLLLLHYCSLVNGSNYFAGDFSRCYACSRQIVIVKNILVGTSLWYMYINVFIYPNVGSGVVLLAKQLKEGPRGTGYSLSIATGGEHFLNIHILNYTKSLCT